MTQARIYLSPPHMSGKEINYIQRALETNWVAPIGPNVDGFEREIAAKVGAKGAIAVSSGTAAIHLSLALLGVTKGDLVFCSTLTFVASANPILYQGATPVFIDSEPSSWNMSPQALARALRIAALQGKLPKAVIVVNLYGQSANMNEILRLCNEYDIPMIEDAAESLGSLYQGKASGTFGEFGIYSFNGNKIITTSGGGMLVSNNTKALEKARYLASQAKDTAVHYQHSVMGFNYRMSNLLAGVGRSQLQVLDERVMLKRKVFATYVHALSDLPGVTFMEEMEDTHSNRWLTTLTIDASKAGITATQILASLHEENIEARPVWKPLHLQPLFQTTRYYAHGMGLSVSDQLFETGICLPSGSNLTEVEQHRVIRSIRSHFDSAIGTRDEMKLQEYEV